AWVRIPTLSTSINTYIYMYYGNTAIASDQSLTSTWDANFMGVYHFNNNINNYTGSAGLNGTNNGTANSAGGKIDQNRSFVRASNQYVDVTPSNAAFNLTGNITVSAWIKLSSLNNDQKIAGTQDNSTGGWKFGVFSDNKVEFEIRTSGNSPSLNRAGWCGACNGGTVLTTATWYYVVGQYSDAGDYIQTYVNGALDRAFTSNLTVLGTSTGSMKFGREPWAANTAQWDGNIDEIHISNSIRSSDWIATEYNNQNSPSTFYSISSEPYRWSGTTNTLWNTGTNWVGGVVPPSDADVIITNVANLPTLDVSKQIGAMWVQSSATVNLSSNTLSYRYDITNCGTVTGSTGTVNANSTTHTQMEYFSGSGTFNLNHLTVNNTFAPSPGLTLMKDVNVSGTLTLTSGIVYTTTTNILALSSTASSTSGSSTSYVSGPMSKDGNTNFIFPVGKGGNWRRCAVTNITASTTFRAEYFNSGYTSLSPVNAPLTDVSMYEYWQCDRIVGSGNANLTLYFENATASGINNCPDLTIARWNGASWDERPGTASGTCSGAGTGSVVTNAALTAFSPFTFGSKSWSVNPLPIQLLNFTATPINNYVQLDWSTATETNNDYFTVERSKNGSLFEPLVVVDGAGNSTQTLYYTTNDEMPYTGLSYYRLKQTDFNGSFTYSQMVPVNFDGGDFVINVYPNPNAGDFNVSISGAGDHEVLVVITDVLGREFYSKLIPVGNSNYLLSIDGSQALAAGVYIVTASSDNKLYNQKIVVR
ncbi:MAG TPA: LamG-like jellyroll fold domain-containing protein, partial [Bacteroidia bacterium]